jgi:hypothetical protein
VKVLTDCVGAKVEADSRKQLERLAFLHGRTVSQELRQLIQARLRLAWADGELQTLDRSEETAVVA